MNAKKIRTMIENGEELPIEAQRHIIRIRHLELFKRYIKTHFIAPEVEPELLKTSARELLKAYIENGNWLSAPVQKMMLEDEYIGAFKLYTAKAQLKNNLHPELINPSRFMQYETFLNNGKYLNPKAEELLFKPENAKALTRYIQTAQFSREIQKRLLQPENRDIFEKYLQYRRLSPKVEAQLLEPENFNAFCIYNRHYALSEKNQHKMLNSNNPELLRRFLSWWHLCKSARCIQMLRSTDTSLPEKRTLQLLARITQS